jgi:peptide/nickel transport system permease protein
MGQYLLRRILISIPTILFISFFIFALLDLAPGDPTANLPLTVPLEVRQQIRASLGLDDPFLMRYGKWLYQFFVVEPLNALEGSLGIQIGDSSSRLQLTSWTSRGIPVVELIRQRLPQTLWVVGTAYLFSVLIALPLGIIAAYRQNSFFDQISSVTAVIGYSLPTFFTGLIVILVFSIWLGWFPTVYNTTVKVTDWNSFVAQLRQMVMPVFVLTFFQMASLSRFTRSAMLENLKLDYVRTARAKGLADRLVLMRHVVRNSLIPVVTLLALGIPGIFGGAIVTEQIFRVNGLGALLISSIYSNDIPVVQTCLVIFAVLVVFFNLVADVLYGVLEPRIRY